MPGSMRDAFKQAGVRVPPQTPSRGGGRGGSGRRAPPSTPYKLPDSYFQTDSDGCRYLNPVFVSKSGLDPYVRAFKGRLTTGQLRRFFNHCRELERQLKVERTSWERLSAKFAALSYHAHNAAAARKIPDQFRDFIDENVKRVLTSDAPRDAFLVGFLLHFEALVGFGATHLKKGS